MPRCLQSSHRTIDQQVVQMVVVRASTIRNFAKPLLTLDGALADNCEAIAIQCDETMVRVGEQYHVMHAQLGQNLRANAIVAQFIHVARLSSIANPQQPRKIIGRAAVDGNDKAS